MSHWHYQAIKHTEDNGDVWYGIHEMYPDLNSWTEEPVRVVGESIEDLQWQLEAMLYDLEKEGVTDSD